MKGTLNSGYRITSKQRMLHASAALTYEQACKPGSVENDHLSRPAVADRLKPPPEDGRAGLHVPVPRCCSG